MGRGGRQKRRDRRVKSEGTQRIYEDNKWVIVRPFTIEASRMYGGGTKWCTSLKKDKFKSLFYAYIETGILYYILKKGKNPLDDKLNKVCLYKKWSGEEEWADTHDTIKEEKTIRKYKKELGEKVISHIHNNWKTLKQKPTQVYLNPISLIIAYYQKRLPIHISRLTLKWEKYPENIRVESLWLLLLINFIITSPVLIIIFLLRNISKH